MVAELGRATFGRMLSRRHLVIGGALAAASAVAFARQPTVRMPLIKAGTFDKWVPLSFAGWTLVGSSGVILPPPDALSDRLYDDLVTRVYSRSDGNVMMLVAYNNRQDGVLQVHRPEVCYPAGGFSLSNERNLTVTALGTRIPAKAFSATGEDRTEQVLYFTRLGSSYPRSWAEQRLAVVEENLAGKIPDGLLFRVSLLGADQDAAVERLRAFVAGFAAAADPLLKRLLVV